MYYCDVCIVAYMKEILTYRSDSYLVSTSSVMYLHLEARPLKLRATLSDSRNAKPFVAAAWNKNRYPVWEKIEKQAASLYLVIATAPLSFEEGVGKIKAPEFWASCLKTLDDDRHETVRKDDIWEVQDLQVGTLVLENDKGKFNGIIFQILRREERHQPSVIGTRHRTWLECWWRDWRSAVAGRARRECAQACTATWLPSAYA